MGSEMCIRDRSRVRRLNGLEAEKSFQEGLIVKLLGIEVYNHVE